MSADGSYRVWAADNMVYGPISAETLKNWITENRVEGDTWIFDSRDNSWRTASELTRFQDCFTSNPANGASTPSELGGSHFDGVTHEGLRQFPIFASLSDEDLAEFVGFTEIFEAHNDEVIVKKGDPGDALFLVLQGQVRVRLVVSGVEKHLGRIGAGEFFGEMVMFRQGARSADVVSEGKTRLMRLGLGPFQLLMSTRPALALPLLFGIASTMAKRLAADARRFEEDAAPEFLWMRNRIPAEEPV